MFAHSLFLKNKEMNIKYSRKRAVDDLVNCLEDNQVENIFAYNASFDYRHLPELSSFAWYDIMKVAAYRQYNPKIPHTAACYSTGRLKCGYGVESILRMLSGDFTYREQHNALVDARDELKIMELLQHKPSNYIRL